jgi:hypothetical protein
MEKRTKTKKESPEEIAKDFWAGLFHKAGERIARIQHDIFNSISDPQEKEQQRPLLNFMTELKALPQDAPVGSLEETIIKHKYLVKPFVPWKEVTDTLGEFQFDTQAIEDIVLCLKPVPIEQHLGLIDNPIQDSQDQAIREAMDFFKGKIKTLSPLAKKLENLTKEDGYRNLLPLKQTILCLRWDIEIYKAIVKDRQDNDKRYRAIHLIDENLHKSPQKHPYWRELATRVLKLLNAHCHDGACEPGCRKTHKKAYIKVAQLLKILYPTIWTQKIEIIANKIKSMEQRQL